MHGNQKKYKTMHPPGVHEHILNICYNLVERDSQRLGPGDGCRWQGAKSLEIAQSRP